MRYKDFDIEAFEDEPSWFKASIKRSDGRMIRAAVPGSGTAGLPAPAMVTEKFPSEEAAIDQAKRSIDAGGIVLA